MWFGLITLTGAFLLAHLLDDVLGRGRIVRFCSCTLCYNGNGSW